MFVPSLLLGLLGCVQVLAQDLRFGPIDFAGNLNYVLRDNVTSAQVVVSNTTSTKPVRFITAFPNGNTGAMVYFLPVGDGTLGAQLDLGSLASVSQDNNQTGITGNFTLTGDADFGVSILGSVRSLRDYVEGGGVMHSIFNYTLGPNSATGVTLVRNWINGTTVQYLTFEAANNCNFTVTPAEAVNGTTPAPAIKITRMDTANNATIKFTSVFNFTGTTPTTPYVALKGLDAAGLFKTAGSNSTSGGNSTTGGGSTSGGNSTSGGSTATPGGNSTMSSSAMSSSNQMTSTSPAGSGQSSSSMASSSPVMSSEPAASSSPTATDPIMSINFTMAKTSNFAANTSVLDSVLSAISTSAGPITEQLAFLSYASESLAGGWRFLTYFGRDTLIALRLLLPVFSPEASEGILAAVIERVNTTGELCHEETVGDYASFINMNNNQSERGNQPSYAYTMVDTDFLLLPVLADYLASAPDRAESFLARNSSLRNGTYASLVRTNIEHVLSLAAPFAAVPIPQNLIPVRSYPVGNWRDSAMGIGYGMYPFDVNCALVPATLHAIARLGAAGHISSNYSYTAGNLSANWDASACDHFKVDITQDDARSRLDNYVTKANLSSSLLNGSGSLSGPADAGWNDTAQLIGGSANSTFYAISLYGNFTPVEVLHSDLSFVLYYTDPSEDLIRATVQSLQAYPRGLLTNAGMVVANAAYDTDTTHIDMFDNTMYHGAVSWSWQTGMMAAGLSRQLGRCGLSNNTQLEASTNDTAPVWCNDTTLTNALEQSQTRLWSSIHGTQDAIWTEVWSPVYDNSTNSFIIGDLGALSQGTEGDAIQLWSYGFLAAVDPTTSKPVAAGFDQQTVAELPHKGAAQRMTVGVGMSVCAGLLAYLVF